MRVYPFTYRTLGGESVTVSGPAAPIARPRAQGGNRTPGGLIIPSGYYSGACLIKRGWTRARIKKLLGEPDDVRETNLYGGRLRVNLYRMNRVHEAEAKD